LFSGIQKYKGRWPAGWKLSPLTAFLYLYGTKVYMQEHKQITLSFDQAAEITAAEKQVIAEASLPKKRGRKPKPPPLVPKQPSKRGRLSLKEAAHAEDLINIPDDETLFQKRYYSIGQVAEMFHVNHSLLRMWANEFDDFLQTKKNKKGDRYFRPEDIKTLEFIHHLLRKRKFTTQGARDFLKKNKNADERFAVIQSMQKVKMFLLEIKDSL
jgi:DNA-binding transcriptional MerR regulator